MSPRQRAWMVVLVVGVLLMIASFVSAVTKADFYEGGILDWQLYRDHSATFYCAMVGAAMVVVNFICGWGSREDRGCV